MTVFERWLGLPELARLRRGRVALSADRNVEILDLVLIVRLAWLPLQSVCDRLSRGLTCLLERGLTAAHYARFVHMVSALFMSGWRRQRSDNRYSGPPPGMKPARNAR
jgi:hypothetical protein